MRWLEERATATSLPDEDPPAGAESQFTTDFSRHSVPYSEILSGGPPKDSIPAIDEPQSTPVDQADAWLEPQEPVILLQIGGDARAYPNPDSDVARDHQRYRGASTRGRDLRIACWAYRQPLTATLA